MNSLKQPLLADDWRSPRIHPVKSRARREEAERWAPSLRRLSITGSNTTSWTLDGKLHVSTTFSLSNQRWAQDKPSDPDVISTRGAETSQHYNERKGAVLPATTGGIPPLNHTSNSNSRVVEIKMIHVTGQRRSPDVGGGGGGRGLCMTDR